MARTQEQLNQIVKASAPGLGKHVPDGVGYILVVWNRDAHGAAGLGTNTSGPEYLEALRKLLDWARSRQAIVPPPEGFA